MLTSKKFINQILYWRDRLQKRANLINGFIEVPPTETDYIHEEGRLGFVAKKVLLPSKNWKPYRSTGEEQRRPNSSETMACVTYSCHKAIEQIMNFMKTKVEAEETDAETQELVRIFKHFEFYNDKGEADLSDPFTAKLSGTSNRGNSFTNVCQSFRHNGVVAEKYHPTPEKYTWNEYYKTIPQFAIDKGKEFTNFVEIKHEWVAPEEFNETKKYSPNTTSVYAGHDWNVDKIHPHPANYHNHAVDNDYCKDNEFDGIFDSYKPFDKKVSWNYGLGNGKIFTFVLKNKIPDPLDELLEKYDGQSVKCKESSAVYHLQNGKKKAYPDEITYLSFNVKDKYITSYNLIEKSLLDRIERGDNMDIRKSYYWEFLKNIKGNEARLKKLIELIIA